VKREYCNGTPNQQPQLMGMMATALRELADKTNEKNLQEALKASAQKNR